MEFLKYCTERNILTHLNIGILSPESVIRENNFELPKALLDIPPEHLPLDYFEVDAMETASTISLTKSRPTTMFWDPLYNFKAVKVKTDL